MSSDNSDHGRPVGVGRHFGTYTVGAAISLACSVALLPVYATLFTPAAFGLVAAAQVIAVIVTTIARLGITSGMFRFVAVTHSAGDQGATRAVVTTSFVATVASSAAVGAASLILIMLAGRSLSAEIASVADLIALNVIASAPRDVAELTLRAKQRSVSYVWLSSAYLVASTLLVTVASFVTRGSAPAVFAATLAANLVIAPYAMWAIRRDLSLSALSAVEAKRVLRFGLPATPALLADWITQYSDRLFLVHYSGLAAAGVYSLAYRLGMIEQQILGTAAQATWDPYVLSTYRSPGAPLRIGRLATYLAVAGMLVVVLLSASTPAILSVIRARPEYFGATNLVFLIALANFFGVVQYLFATPTSLVLRPEIGTLLRFSAAVTNAALNLLLIPRFGMLGAAWATVITYAFTAVISDFVARRLWRIAFEYWKLFVIVGSGVVVQVFVQLLLATKDVLVQPILVVGAPVLLITSLWITRTVSWSELTALRREGPSATVQGSPSRTVG